MPADYVKLLGKNHALELVCLLAHSSGMNYAELLRLSDLNYVTMINRLKDLRSAGLVEKESFENRHTIYTISSLGREIYMKYVLPSLKLIEKRLKVPRL